MIEAVKNGLFHASMKDELTRLEHPREELQQALAGGEQPAPLIHPGLAALYHEKVADLHTGLNAPAPAKKLLRSCAG